MDCKAKVDGVNAVREEEPEQEEQVMAFKSVSERENAYQRDEERAGKCPMCKEAHTYQRRTKDNMTLEWPSAQLISCPLFNRLSPIEKGKKVEELRGCPKCTGWGHQGPKCWKDGLICKHQVDNQRCKRYHATELHHSNNQYCKA